MSRQGKWKAALLVAVAAGAIGGGAFALQKWQAGRPTQANFDKAVRALWEEAQAAGGGTQEACVQIPRYPQPDARSTSTAPLAWHMDFLSDTPRPPARERQLRQLDALARVGLLERTEATLEVDGDVKPVNRYRLTEAGWASAASSRGADCLVYGTPQFLGVQRFAPKAVSAEAGLEVYEVQARTGIPSPAQLAPWARDAGMQAAFPEIRETLAGRDWNVLLVRGSGRWVEYSTLLREMARDKAAQEQPGMRELRARFEAEQAQQRKAAQGLRPPSEAEVRALLAAEFGPSAKTGWPAPCVTLPGDDRFPVDMRLSTYSPLHYSVAVFRDKERTPRDRVLPRTQPYLERLVGLGVLTKRQDNSVRDGKKGSTALHEADVYELAPAYAQDLRPEDPHCLWLGAPRLRVVALRMGEAGSLRPAEAAIGYKLRITYPAAPVWMKDRRLMSAWPALRGAVEAGYACAGEFGFDLRSRQKESGGGSCWWADYSDSDDG